MGTQVKAIKEALKKLDADSAAPADGRAFADPQSPSVLCCFGLPITRSREFSGTGKHEGNGPAASEGSEFPVWPNLAKRENTREMAPRPQKAALAPCTSFIGHFLLDD